MQYRVLLQVELRLETPSICFPAMLGALESQQLQEPACICTQAHVWSHRSRVGPQELGGL